WQPVRSRYNTAQTTSYKSSVAGLMARRTLRSNGCISVNAFLERHLGHATTAQALHAAHALHHLHEAATLHLLHHALHLFELLEQAVDFLHMNSGTTGDALLARGLDEFRFAALQRRHALDDAFLALDVLLGLVHVHRACLGRELRRKLVHQAGEAAHLLHLLDLRKEIVEIEPVAALDL